MREATGATATTKATALRGAGILYFNIDEDELRDGAAVSEAAAATAAKAAGVAIGATKNGVNAIVRPITFEAGFDGYGPNDSENIVHDEHEASLSVSFVELVQGIVQKVIHNVTATDLSNGFTEIKPNQSACVPDFVTNIAVFIESMDCAQSVPTIFVVRNAHNGDGFNLQTASKQINAYNVNYKGHYKRSDSTGPFSLYIPTPA